MKPIGCVILSVLLATTPAAAQTWQTQSAPERDMTAALVAWPNGYAMGVRCEGEDFQVLVRSPAALPDTEMFLTFDDGDASSLASPDGRGNVVFSRIPARVARRLIAGGQIRLEVAGQPIQILDLPIDAGAVTAVLTACDRPLEADRDAVPLAAGVDWLSRPSGMQMANAIPRRAVNTSLVFRVNLSCILQASGRVDRCEVESESPAGYGMGAASRQVANYFRMREPAPDQVGRVVVIPLTWSMPDSGQQ